MGDDEGVWGEGVRVGGEGDAVRVRGAEPEDWLAVSTLIQEAWVVCPVVWAWTEHLGHPGFVVAEVDGRIEGALFASADESPAAWVRLAAVGEGLDVDGWLDASLPPVLGHLQREGVRRLAWMAGDEGIDASLERRGFHELTEVITLRKTDRALPEGGWRPVPLRPASDADFEAMAAIDRRAFAPYWWRSPSRLRRQAARASRFVVGERQGEVIGYAEFHPHPPTSHLNRMAVDPAHQGEGIGGWLLREVLISLWEQGVEVVSLNTQRDNRRSLRLYEKFGFEVTGDRVTVWELELGVTKT